jgi:Ca-activated chloride channel family protein
VPAPATPPSQYDGNAKTLNIIAGSEQETILNEIVLPWCKDKGITCNFVLKGSVDQAQLLKEGNAPYDIFWFASDVFLQIGDQDGKLTHVQPMFITPLVYAGWQSEMQKLGFVGRDDVTLAEILSAVESGKTTTWLTNPTQSNSGATVLFGFMNYFAGNGPNVALTQQQLDSPAVQDGITRFSRAMNQTPPSSGTLMNDCVKNENVCRSLFVYEALVIEKNLELTKQGHEPLYVVYPKETLAIANAPMGFLSHGGSAAAAKEKNMVALQDYLLSDQGQQRVLALGRRPVKSIGLTLTNPDKKVFNDAWGIKSTVRLQAFTYPSVSVIQQALNRYQTLYRNPVDSVYCLDGSGSMQTRGWSDVVKGSQTIFDQNIAAQYYLQSHPDDITTVMVFNSAVAGGPWEAAGNDPTKLLGLYDNIRKYTPGDGTNMYTCINRAVQIFNQRAGENRKRLLVLMTDGRSDEGGKDQAIRGLQTLGIPAISIVFGDADKSQLQQLADATHGTVVDQGNLVDALRTATGYR